MNWLEIAAIAAIIVGVGAAGFLVAQRPSFWYGLLAHAVKDLTPIVLGYILKRNTPDVEAKMHDCIRRGGTWDNFKKRCRD